ncbi:MAG TPA: hypothetical protein VF453_18560 [Burkholderiaceae bacterium]
MTRDARRWTPAVAALASALAGCSSIGGFTGAVAGAATGTFSSNPTVGVAVGVSVKAATDAAMNRVFRGMQSDEQDRIAELAGQLDVGDRRSWQVHHLFSYGDEAGELQVLGSIDNALASCKEVLFSVAGGKRDAPTRQWFVTQTCRQSDGRWRWAAAEPATGRWGSLQ